MSRRTSKANKAIAMAWQNEQELVRDGQGTRNWTQEQQQDILNRGKAYDENGRAFEGHHMKSAEKYPEYQGDVENIQFLTKLEHLMTHQGNWRNPTNWYYDPATKQITDFGENQYIPCPVIDLSKPLITNDNLTDRIFEEENSVVPKQNNEMAEEPRKSFSTFKSGSTDKIAVVNPQTITRKTGFFKHIMGGATKELKKLENLLLNIKRELVYLL